MPSVCLFVDIAWNVFLTCFFTVEYIGEFPIVFYIINDLLLAKINFNAIVDWWLCVIVHDTYVHDGFTLALQNFPRKISLATSASFTRMSLLSDLLFFFAVVFGVSFWCDEGSWQTPASFQHITCTLEWAACFTRHYRSQFVPMLLETLILKYPKYNICCEIPYNNFLHFQYIKWCRNVLAEIRTYIYMYMEL